VYSKASRRDFLYSFFVISSVSFRSEATALQAESDSNKKTPAETYEPGGAVKAPKLIHYVEPEFSSQSKEAFIEGIVKISTIVTAEGRPSEPRVIRGLNAEEDRTALEALKQWRFQPGTKEGKPVNVKVTIEIAFHLL
jgi:TonB family protein